MTLILDHYCIQMSVHHFPSLSYPMKNNLIWVYTWFAFFSLKHWTVATFSAIFVLTSGSRVVCQEISPVPTAGPRSSAWADLCTWRTSSKPCTGILTRASKMREKSCSMNAEVRQTNLSGTVGIWIPNNLGSQMFNYVQFLIGLDWYTVGIWIGN